MTQLNYKIIDLNNESMVLNNMLLENHQTIDELTMENIKLKQKLNDITEQYSTTSNDFAIVIFLDSLKIYFLLKYILLKILISVISKL